MKSTILITSFNEPETIGRAIEHAQKQKTNYEYDIFVSAPDSETLAIAESYALMDDRIKLFKDEGKGKSKAINDLLPKITSDILILTDGDVYISDNSVESIMKAFENPEIGCVSGRPISIEDKKTLFGYWSHFLCDAGADKARQKRADKEEYFEISAYLMAFRNRIINEYPLDVAEDAYISYIFYKKGYRIKYIPQAVAYVAYPKNLKDFIEQKKRTAKSHETLEKYIPKDFPRMKSFKNEILEGFFAIFSYPNNLKEFYWTFCLIFIRLYTWVLMFYDIKIKKEQFQDNWKRIESSKK